jgi:hypothetical protein
MRNLYILVCGIVIVSVIIIQYEYFVADPPQPPGPCDQHSIDPIDYSVYRSILPTHESVRGVPGKIILVMEAVDISDRGRVDHRIAGQVTDFYTPMGVNFSRSAIDNYLRNRGHVAQLDPEKFRDLPIVVADATEIEEIFSGGVDHGWESLGEATIVNFSRIGFSCERNQALVYLAYQCGPLCGKGRLIFLEKKENIWKPVFERGLWIS